MLYLQLVTYTNLRTFAMNTNSNFFKDIHKWLCFILLFIMGWQQFDTLSSYEEKFFNPVKFSKETYGNDFITLYGEKFTGLSKMLDASTKLCYVGEPVVPNNGTREMHYALSQYYLAPNVLVRNLTARDSVIFNNGASPPVLSQIACDTVLYNLYTSGSINPATNHHLKNGWQVKKNFDNGLILLVK